MTSPDSIAIRVLGDVQIVGNARPLTPRQQLLLGVLAVRGRPLSIDTLTDLLWPTNPPANPRTALQIHVSRLRRMLEPTGATIRKEGDGYALAVESHRLDVCEFDRLVTEGIALNSQDAAAGIEHFTTALELWRGSPPALLSECSLVRGELSRLDELRATALEARIEHTLSFGQEADVIAELRGLVADHPLREAIARLLVIALTRAGRFAEALDCYEKARHSLSEEFGADPGPELEEAHQQLIGAIEAASGAKPTDRSLDTVSARPPQYALDEARQALLQPATDDTTRGLDYLALAEALRRADGSPDEASDAVSRALELIPDTPTVARARALTANAWNWKVAPERAAESADHAIELTELIGSGELLAHALQRGGAAEAMLGGLDVGRELVLRGRFIAEQAGYRQGLLESFIILADLNILAGQPGDGADAALAGIARATERGDALDRANLVGLALAGLTRSGRWDEARRLVEAVSDDGPLPDTLGTALVRFCALSGDLPRAQATLDRLTARRDWQDARVGLCESWLALCREDWHALHTAATHALRGSQQLAAAEVNELVFLALVALTERTGAAKRKPASRHDVERLIDRLQPDPGGMRTAAPWAELARAEAHTRSWSATDAWESTHQTWGAIDGWSPVRIHIKSRLAVAIGSGAHAAELLTSARADAQQLGSPPLVHLTQRAAAAIGLDPERPWSTVDATSLTPREREVLDLVTEGATNRVIATQLGISEKTASVHVSNLLQKFGAASRTELALLASRTGSADASA